MNKTERPMAQTLNIDTLEFSRRMKEGGVDEKAAETIAKTVAEAIGSSDMATGTQLELTRMELKSDIDKVRTEIDKVRTELKSEIDKVHTELKSEISKVDTKIDKVDTKIDRVRIELKSEIVEFRTELKGAINRMLFKTVASVVSFMTLVVLTIEFLKL